jgi:lysophospholipase L1-like esterase
LLDYRLIIIQYGANIADPNIDNFRWYENQLYEILLKLKSQFPEAGILVVSAADKSMKSDLEYKTNPAIPKIVSAQRNAAKKAEVAFWNLYQAMGGENAMLKWRRQNLVSDDYTHFSHAGAKKIADLLSKALSYGLSHYESSRKIRP